MNNNKYIFTFEWLDGCANDHVIKWLKANNIDFYFEYSALKANFFKNGEYSKYDYEHIKDNIFGILVRK